VGSVLCGEHAIEGGWRAASLEVAQYGSARFAMETALDFISDNLSDTAESLLGATLRFANATALGKLGTFGHDDERKSLALAFAVENFVTNVLVGPGDLGNEDHVAAAGGIRAAAFARELLAAGAQRLGTSASLAILAEA